MCVETRASAVGTVLRKPTARLFYRFFVSKAILISDLSAVESTERSLLPYRRERNFTMAD